MKKKVLSAALTATMFMGMFGNTVLAEAVSDAEAEKGTIYVITSSYATPLFEVEAKKVEEDAEALGYSVKAVSHDDDLTKQSQIIETAIADKAVGIVLDNAGAEGSVEAVKNAKEAGIPTVIIDRELASEGDAIAQFVSNNYQGAQAVAEVFVEAMGEEGKYAELLGKETETACTVRSQGFHDVIDQYEDLEMVAQDTANWNLYNYSSNFPYFTGFPACSLVK